MDINTWAEFERTSQITPNLVQGLIEHNEAEEKRRRDRCILSDFVACCDFCERELNRVPWGF